MVHIRRKPDFKKNSYEMTEWKNQALICGVDEVGRGCLAGPVVCAATIIHTQKTSPLIKDSKLLTASERDKAFSWIKKNCWYNVAVIDHHLIDRINIYQATLLGMKKCLFHILSTAQKKPSIILIDAMPV